MRSDIYILALAADLLKKDPPAPPRAHDRVNAATH